jgi:hypothetical protein
MLPMENKMSYDDEDNRKNFRRKKIKNKKEDSKKIFYQNNDFSYSKIKNQFKQKKRHIEEQDTLEELDDYS